MKELQQNKIISGGAKVTECERLLQRIVGNKKDIMQDLIENINVCRK